MQSRERPVNELPTDVETKIWLDFLSSKGTLPKELCRVMCKRLTNVAKIETSPQVDKIVTDLFTQIEKCNQNQEGNNELTASHIVLLSTLVRLNQNAMDKAKEKEEQLKTLALAWLRRAKENPG